MSIENLKRLEAEPILASRRKSTRYSYLRSADWDFFTASSGAKKGYIENISEGGCLFRASEPIEHRRWLRLIVREKQTGFFFTAVGRVIRREDKMELVAGTDEGAITLHRYGIQFVHPLNSVVLDRITASETLCADCSSPGAQIADIRRPNVFYCRLCHLRRACHSLLAQENEPA